MYRNADPFSSVGWIIIAIVGVLVLGVGKCGSCLGIEYWDNFDSAKAAEAMQQREDQKHKKWECQAECKESYPDTWKEPDATLWNACFDAC